MSATSPLSIRTRLATGADLGSAIPPLLQRIYRARGIQSADELALGLNRLPAPDRLGGMDAAVAILTNALEKQHKLLIVGDFDADGATSTALGVLGLRALGFEHVDFLVPNRFDYGYGLTPEIVALATRRAAGVPDLIVTVDNGIASVEGVAAANAAGIPVLITDHHLPGRELPAAAAIVNPNQHGCDFPGKHLAGVGVMFYVLLALRAHLRAMGWFAPGKRAEPNLATWLDLVALGTVADMVPLDAINRTLVHQGLARIRAGRLRPGMQALLDIAGRERSRLVAADLGFVVAPRLNAAGRLDDMTIGIHCLLAEDAGQARELAAQLDELNRDRRAIQADMERAAAAAVAGLALDEPDLPWGLCLFDAGWHQGVVGLVAGRVKDSLHRPVIAFAPAHTSGSAELKGSARSIPGLHIRDALEAIATREPRLLQRFGGHALAAGLSLARDQLPAFRAAFDAEVRRQLTPADLAAEIWTDGELAPAEFSVESARLLRAAGPWGQRFPDPSFHGEFRVVSERWLNDKHLKLVVGIGDADSPQFDAIAFNVADRGWPQPLPARVRLVYRLDLNLFRELESVQLLVEHLLP